MYCQHCGHELENDSKFCANCGKKLLQEENEVKNTTDFGQDSNVEKKEESSISNKPKESFFTISKTLYCTNCGSNMGNGKVCPNCNYKRNNGINNYCAYCAESIEDQKCSYSGVAVKTNIVEKLLRFISLFLIYFSFVGVFVKLIDGESLSAVVMGAIAILSLVFVVSKRQIYKLKAFLISKKIKEMWSLVAYVLVIILTIVGINFAQTEKAGLSGDDLAAYNLLTEVSYEFKNPTSVRLVSGKVFYDEEEAEWCGWFAISATNGFGARTVGYYFVGYLDGEIFALDLEENGSSTSIGHAKTRDELDVDSINKALDKKWGTTSNS